jgi:hypothetical protein
VDAVDLTGTHVLLAYPYCMAEWLAAYDPAVQPDSILSCGADVLPFSLLSLLSSQHSIEHQTFSSLQRHFWSPQRSWRFSTTSRLPCRTMVTHGEWSLTGERISKCEGLKMLEEAWNGDLPSYGLELQLQSECPLCQFFRDTTGAPAVSRVSIWPIISPEDHKEMIRGQMIRGAVEIASFTSINRSVKFLLRLSSRDEIESDSPPTSWGQFYRRIPPGKRFPYHCVQKSSVDMEIAKVWVTGCQMKHVSHCADQGLEIMSNIRSLPGFQLIDCTTNKIVVAPKGFQYVALSYVWGQPRAEDGTHINAYNQLDETRLSDVPDTIQDAITVTLRLGYQYLWVDKYCINQALDTSGLQEQLAGMGAIYHGAVFTIIAAAGIDAHYGLPGIGNRPRVEQPSIAIDGVTWVSGSAFPDGPLSRSKWATRGWVSRHMTAQSGLAQLT